MSADGQYMATGKNKVYYFSRAGNLLWSREVEAEMADVAMSADGQHVVAGTQGAAGEVYYFSQDGRLLWNYDYKKVRLLLLTCLQTGNMLLQGLREQ